MGDVYTSPDLLGELLKHEYSRETCREAVTLAANAGGYQMGSVLAAGDGGYHLAAAADTACAVLLADVEGSGSAIPDAVVLAHGPAIVADAKLVYDDSVNTDDLKKAKQEQLAALGIVTREAV